MEDEHRIVCAHVASTPAEAQVLIVRLMGAGIRAFGEGAMLADEVAISQRVMNLQGTRVLVAQRDLAAAREVLAEHEPVDPEELERQAMAAVPVAAPGQREVDDAAGSPRRRAPIGFVARIAAAIRCMRRLP